MNESVQLRVCPECQNGILSKDIWCEYCDICLSCCGDRCVNREEQDSDESEEP